VAYSIKIKSVFDQMDLGLTMQISALMQTPARLFKFTTIFSYI